MNELLRILFLENEPIDEILDDTRTDEAWTILIDYLRHQSINNIVSRHLRLAIQKPGFFEKSHDEQNIIIRSEWMICGLQRILRDDVNQMILHEKLNMLQQLFEFCIRHFDLFLHLHHCNNRLGETFGSKLDEVFGLRSNPDVRRHAIWSTAIQFSNLCNEYGVINGSS